MNAHEVATLLFKYIDDNTIDTAGGDYIEVGGLVDAINILCNSEDE